MAGMEKINQPHKVASQRQAAIPHILYEWTMLLSTCGLLKASHDPAVRLKLNDEAYFAFLESFVVHFRNLYEFLFLTQSGGGYVRAEDYFPSATESVAMQSFRSPIDPLPEN